MSDQPRSPLHQPALHESGFRHVTGEALYVDDLPALQGTLVAQAVVSPHAHARILKRHRGTAAEVPGVAAVFFAEDIPGENNIGAVAHDEPLLAVDEVQAEGQAVALIVADSYAICRRAAAQLEIEYEELPAILDPREAVERESFHGTPHFMRRGDVDEALAAAAVRIQGELHSGGQDHFYLETHAALAVPEENGALRIYSSTQHPSEVQHKVAEAMGLASHEVAVECPRMGGAFGGKETQGNQIAALAAMGALRTGRAVKMWLNRDQDMLQTGKRHPFFSRFDAGFDAQGRLLGLRCKLYANGGWSRDLSQAILDRGLFHLDSSYFVPAVDFEGRVLKTNVGSNTAFRGFGGPQGMLVIDEIFNRAAERLGLDPAQVRERNFYGDAPRNVTPFYQEVTGFRGARIFEELMQSSEYARRREEIERFNARSEHVKRGIGYQPVKFGISFTTSFLNQAGALVLVYADGSVQLNHGGTEMGQGLHTKMLAVCAHELGVPMSAVRIMNTATDKVPNTSATAASSGSDLNGQAIREACSSLRERLRPVAVAALGLGEEDADGLVFAEGRVFLPGRDGVELTFAELCRKAYLGRVSLAATGYYRTPGIEYDREHGRGRPFHYFAYGGAVTEVEVSALTGEHRALRVDILHDVGTSLVPSIDIGQIEGGYIQGLGWLTSEELVWDEQGHLLTHAPSTYKIPAIGEAPEDFRVKLLERAPQEGVIHGSKAVGEPPFMLAISALTALRHAIGSYAAIGQEVNLGIPATPEAILRAIERARARQSDAKSAAAE